MIKRVLDIFIIIDTFSFITLLFLVLSFVYFQDFHNPLVSIKRNGIYGKEFKMLKVRTMKPNSHSNREEMMDLNERKGPFFKIHNDPRLIKNLLWVRKYSLDEIPQLLNVIKGEMSLVGPRPLFSDDLKKFTEEQTIRLCVLPGITGLLQINDRETEDFNDWFYWDKYYIDNWSIKLDIEILIKTFFVLFKRTSL